ncbi:MAG: hypothetical protein KBS91_02245 [Firmicutes bacterium]|nr:hypothetical protein [Candidatus Caballimonas caccae]
MENKNEQKKLISIVITLCSLFLALILAVSTFAWMSMNRKLFITGANFTIGKNEDLGIYKIKILKREGADNAKDVSGSGNVALTEYDTVFTDKNVNTSIMMRLELGGLPIKDGVYQPFHLRVKCGGADTFIQNMEGYSTDNVQEKEDEWVNSGAVFQKDEGATYNQYWQQSDGKFSQVLSNIIGIRCGLGNTTINALTDDNDIYTGAKEYLETPPVGAPVLPEQTFLNSVGTEKKGILQFEFKNYGDYVNDSEMVVVYIDVNYNDTLITLFSEQLGFSTSSFDDSTGSTESVHFTSDLTNCFIFMGDKEDN